MSELLSDKPDVNAVVEIVSSLWEQQGADVPEWAVQELTFGQMRLLFLLGKHGPSPMSHIAEWLGVGLPAASGTVERVERHGLVERQHRVDDRRVVECQLTVAGRELLEEIAGMHREVLRQALCVLTGDELSELARLISIVVERTKDDVNVVASSRVTEVEEAVSATLPRIQPGAPRPTACPIDLPNPNEPRSDW